MKYRFDKLAPDKKEQIIALTVSEFAEKSFTDASTDFIAKTAGIAKGSLFNYFGSKKELYLYALRYCVTDVLKTAQDCQTNCLDAREALIGRFLTRLRYCRENSDTVRFIQRAAYELSDEVFEDKQAIINAYTDEYDKASASYIDNFINAANLKNDRITARETLYMFWNGLSMFLLDRYKREPERVLSDSDVLYMQVKNYFNILFDGMCGNT